MSHSIHVLASNTTTTTTTNNNNVSALCPFQIHYLVEKWIKKLWRQVLLKRHVFASSFYSSITYSLNPALDTYEFLSKMKS
jgi:hypothetical protein